MKKLFTSLFLIAIAAVSAWACDVPGNLQSQTLSGTTVKLSWTAVAGATGYRVQVENANNNPQVYHVETSVATTFYFTNGLIANANYKFKVRAVCGGDKSDWSDNHFFSTGTTGGGACVAPAGLSVSNLSGTGATLSWSAVSGVTLYEVEVEDGENTPPYAFNTVTGATTINITGLTPNGNYKFKVKSKCGSGSSVYSDWFLFNSGLGGNGGGGTGGGGTGGACEIPSGLSISGITDNSATLSWTAVAGATAYEVEVEDDENTAPFQYSVVVNGTSVTVTGLAANGNYQFKVKSKCNSGSSDYSAWSFFSTGNAGGGNTGGGGTGGACDIPSGLSVSNLTGNSATLSWSAVAGALQYEVEVEDDNNTPLFNYHVITNDTAIVVTGLVAGGNYQFKVKSKCGTASSDYAAWFLFGSGGSNTGGGGNTGACNIPSGLQAINISSTGATLIWSDAASALQYEVEVEDGSGTPAYFLQAITSDTSIIVIGLVPNGNYKFKVKSKCGSGSSDYSAWVFFTTPPAVAPPVPGAGGSVQAAAVQPRPEFNMYPNPGINEVTIQLASGTEIQVANQLRVFNAQGQLMIQRNDLEDQETLTLDVANWQPGMYRVMVGNAQGFQTKTLAVVR